MIDGHTSIVQRQARSRRINAAANSTRRLVHPLPDNDLRRSRAEEGDRVEDDPDTACVAEHLT